MAHINHFYREQDVYGEQDDGRGFKWNGWHKETVEHFTCSVCRGEVKPDSKFCSHCGEKLSGIKEEYKETSCAICDAKFQQLAHKNEECCQRCREVLANKYSYNDIARAFYALGKQEKKGNKQK